MKTGHNVRIINLDFYEPKEGEDRPDSLIGKTGKIVDMYLGIFKVKIGKEEIHFDGREIEIADKLIKSKADFSFVSWQRAGKSVYNSEDDAWLFQGDFHRGVTFKGAIELTEEEIERVEEAKKRGIVPVFDLHIIKEDKRKNRRLGKSQKDKKQ